MFEQILGEEISEHLGAEPYCRSPSRRGQRDGRYERDLVSGVGPIRQLQVPSYRDGISQSELFGRYRRIIERLQDQVMAWRERKLDGPCPYLYLDAIISRRTGASAWPG